MSSLDILIWILQIKCSFCRTNVLELVLFYDEMCYEQNEDVHAYPFTSFVGKKQLHLF